MFSFVIGPSPLYARWLPRWFSSRHQSHHNQSKNAVQEQQTLVVKGSMYARVYGFGPAGSHQKVYRGSTQWIAEPRKALQALFYKSKIEPQPRVEFFDAQNNLLHTELLVIPDDYRARDGISRRIQGCLEQRPAAVRAEALGYWPYERMISLRLFDKDGQLVAITDYEPWMGAMTLAKNDPIPVAARAKLRKLISNPDILSTLRVSRILIDNLYSKQPGIEEVESI